MEAAVVVIQQVLTDPEVYSENGSVNITQWGVA